MRKAVKAHRKREKIKTILAENPHALKYKKAPKTLVVNENDPDLQPITIDLPQPGDKNQPELKDIDGYGLAPSEQYFKRPKVPKKLIDLEKRCKTIKECHVELKKNKKYYAEEIKFIQTEWKRRKNGYWFYNNGVPTWISGAHYLYLCYWYVGVNHPEYRSRDRKFFVFAWYVDNDLFACGFNYPKFRREGATSKTSCLIYHIISMQRKVHGGIQSKDDESAAKVFKGHVVASFKKMRFWFRPINEGKTEPKASLNFSAPAQTVTKDGGSIQFEDSLESFIDFGSSVEGYYDGDKLRVHFGDEVGKSTNIDVYQRHLIVKPCVTEGNKYIGLIVNTSTVGDMDKGGGENFKKLCKNSHHHQRNENGETQTGLYNLFIPSFDGYDLVDKKTGKRFIDKHGNSDEDACRKYHENIRKGFIESDDMEGLSEHIRQYPFTFRECFRSGAAHCNFNINILETRLEEFHFGNKFKTPGNFQWKDGKMGGIIGKNPDGSDIWQDGEVKWVPSAKGRFLISYILPQIESNKFILDSSVRVPANKHLFVAGGDTFKFSEVVGTRKSDGAGAVFRKFNPAIDNPLIEVKDWQTNKFCCTYSHRPRTLDLYGEDMLMMCIYFGCEMFPEVNVPFLWEYFKRRGYGGYLYYQIDMKSGKFSKTPGASTNPKVQEALFGEMYNYIEQYGAYEVHDEILIQCRDIVDDMGEFDLFVASTYALLAAKRQVQAPIDITKVQSYHRKYKYSKN